MARHVDTLLTWFPTAQLISPDCRRLSTPRLLFIGRVLGQARIVLRLISAPPGVVHINASLNRRSVLRDLLAVFIGSKRHVVVLQFHGGDADGFVGSKVLQRLLRGMLVRAAVVLVLTSDHRDAFLSIEREANVHLARNYVEIGSPPERTWPKHHIAFVGRLAPEKGILESIAAIQSINLEGDIALTLSICGDGPLIHHIRSIAEVDPRIICRGHVPRFQVEQVLENSDLLILVSEREALPFAVLEAAAKGVPSLLKSGDDFAELFGQRRAAALVSGADPCEIVKVLTELYRHPVNLASMSRAARDLVKDEYSATIGKEFFARVHSEAIQLNGPTYSDN